MEDTLTKVEVHKLIDLPSCIRPFRTICLETFSEAELKMINEEALDTLMKSLNEFLEIYR